jgi:hypothetical protein
LKSFGYAAQSKTSPLEPFLHGRAQFPGADIFSLMH